jgi:hypothetical protein
MLSRKGDRPFTSTLTSLIADADGHQSLPLSKCAYEADARFLADPGSLSSTTLCGK